MNRNTARDKPTCDIVSVNIISYSSNLDGASMTYQFSKDRREVAFCIAYLQAAIPFSLS